MQTTRCAGASSAAGGSALLPAGPKIYKNRFKDCWRASKPLFFQGVFYTICLELFAALGLQHVLRHYREDIEHFMALLSGVPQQAPLAPLPALNNMAVSEVPPQ